MSALINFICNHFNELYKINIEENEESIDNFIVSITIERPQTSLIKIVIIDKKNTITINYSYYKNNILTLKKTYKYNQHDSVSSSINDASNILSQFI
jgi:hydrogenase maturation factor HypF (carbamoyltransferase family)